MQSQQQNWSQRSSRRGVEIGPTPVVVWMRLALDSAAIPSGRHSLHAAIRISGCVLHAGIPWHDGSHRQSSSNSSGWRGLRYIIRNAAPLSHPADRSAALVMLQTAGRYTLTYREILIVVIKRLLINDSGRKFSAFLCCWIFMQSKWGFRLIIIFLSSL